MVYNLMLEATGRLQKCRLYEMSNNKAFRSTVSYLIVLGDVSCHVDGALLADSLLVL